MNEYRLVEALNGSLDRLAAGQTVEDCLRAYPDVVDELRPLLAVGQSVFRTRANAAEVRAMRLRLDPRIFSLIEETPFKSSHFRLSQGSVTLLAAMVALIIVGVVLLLRAEVEQPQLAGQIILTLAPVSSNTPLNMPKQVFNNTLCRDINPNWLELAIADVKDGTYTDGILIVTISNADIDPASNQSISFDWSSTLPVEGVIVRGGRTADNFYRYMPSATSDKGLSPDNQGSDAGQALFCYIMNTQLSTQTATASPSSHQSVDNQGAVQVDNIDDGAVGNGQNR